jgi:hypothetical protein
MPAFPPPSELEAAQKTLYSVFVDPSGARQAAQAHPEALELLHDGPPIDRPTRLSVYGDAYFLRALEALSSDHSAILRAIGESDFRILAAEYVTAHPSTSASLADLGSAFPAFVSRHRFADRHGFLTDLARLERAANEALLTERLPPLDPQSVRAISAEDWDSARLVFDPTVSVHDFAWPILQLWQHRDDALDAPRRTLRRSAPQTVLLWRDDIWTRAESIEPAQGAMLRRLFGGEPLGALFDALPEVSGKGVTLWFSTWMGLGLVRRIEKE